jgi:hypothetical protein
MTDWPTATMKVRSTAKVTVRQTVRPMAKSTESETEKATPMGFLTAKSMDIRRQVSYKREQNQTQYSYVGLRDS